MSKPNLDSTIIAGVMILNFSDKVTNDGAAGDNYLCIVHLQNKILLIMTLQSHSANIYRLKDVHAKGLHCQYLTFAIKPAFGNQRKHRTFHKSQLTNSGQEGLTYKYTCNNSIQSPRFILCPKKIPGRRWKHNIWRWNEFQYHKCQDFYSGIN